MFLDQTAFSPERICGCHIIANLVKIETMKIQGQQMNVNKLIQRVDGKYWKLSLLFDCLRIIVAS